MKKNIINTVVILLTCCYFFFLSRRGGESKNIFSLLIMGTVLLYSYREGINKYLSYKKEIFISVLYLLVVIYSYMIETDKGHDKLYTFLHTTLYSVGFMLVLINYKLETKYVKYILPALLLISFPSIFKGLRDFYQHFESFETIGYYRISGETYTTRYAAELGIYFLLGVITTFYYKKIYIKILCLAYTLLNLILIFGTQSRNTFLALPLVLIFMSILIDWRKGIIISLIILGSVGTILKYSDNSIGNVNRIKSSISSIEKIKQDARYIIFSDGIRESKNHLFVGEGFLHNKGGKLYLAGEALDHYHNNFIETAVTQGILGLMVYVIFLLCLFIRMLKNYFKENNRNKKYIKLLAVILFVFSNFYGLFEPIFYMEKIYQLLFTIIAISFVIDESSSKIIYSVSNDI